MLVRVEVDEGFSESSAVVARRDFHETLDGKGRFDGSIGRSCDIVERCTVDDDFHDGLDSFGYARSGAEFLAERGAVFRVGAGDQKFVLAARFARAGRYASWKRGDDVWGCIRGLGGAVRRFDGGVLRLSEEPKIASHDPVGVSEASREKEFSAEGRNGPAFVSMEFASELMTISEESDLAPEFKVGIAVEGIEASGRGAGENILR